MPTQRRGSRGYDSAIFFQCPFRSMKYCTPPYPDRPTKTTCGGWATQCSWACLCPSCCSWASCKTNSTARPRHAQTWARHAQTKGIARLHTRRSRRRLMSCTQHVGCLRLTPTLAPRCSDAPPHLSSVLKWPRMKEWPAVRPGMNMRTPNAHLLSRRLQARSRPWRVQYRSQLSIGLLAVLARLFIQIVSSYLCVWIWFWFWFWSVKPPHPPLYQHIPVVINGVFFLVVLSPHSLRTNYSRSSYRWCAVIRKPGSAWLQGTPAMDHGLKGKRIYM